MIKLIKKRDGRLQKFDPLKISSAINKAYEGTKEMASLQYALDITLKLNEKNIEVIDIEEVQDEVEKYLMQIDPIVAKKYILYRQNRQRIRNIKQTTFNYKKTIEDYLRIDDWRVKENSTVNYSLGGLILNNSGAITANYWLSEVYDEEIAMAHRNADIHIHDLSMLSAYCAGWDLEKVLKYGVGGVAGKITSKPAKHLSTLSNQLVNFLGIMQNEWAGAQAFSSFDTYLAPFVKVDKLSYEQVKQAIQSFVFGVNTPSRWGSQAPFSNITLDWVVPNDLSERFAIVGGVEQDFKYKDVQAEMDIINKAFLEVMIEGDANGRGFQYPIPTYSITKDFNWQETENNKLLFEMTAKYGTPYFSNYINSDMDPSDVRSMCCRLRLDLRELRKKSGGYFGSGANTGSIGVVTINLPRLAYLAKDKEDFYQKLDEILDLGARSLHIKRDVITKLLDDGLYPYTKFYLGDFSNHFSTIGLVGMNEACLNASWLGKNLLDKAAYEFTKEVLNHMRNRLSDYQEQYKALFNLEATPAESTAYRLAKHDKERFCDIITATNRLTPYYTNSSHLPVGATESITEALNIQNDLQVLYTSGTVFHTFLGQKLPNWQSAMCLVKKIAENYTLPYFTISPTYSICKTHGYINGESKVCPWCGEETEVYSRITGYYRPIKNWNDGKQAEYNNRKEYVTDNAEFQKHELNSDPFKSTHRSCEQKLILFTTKSCPNCLIAKEYLDKNKISYEIILADEETALSLEYKIMSVPTLVKQDEISFEKFVNYSNIVKFIQSQYGN